MAIKLCVKPYCETCEEFVPDTTKNLYCGAPDLNQTYVYCEFRDRCENIYDHIKREFEKEKNNGN